VRCVDSKSSHAEKYGIRRDTLALEPERPLDETAAEAALTETIEFAIRMPWSVRPRRVVYVRCPFVVQALAPAVPPVMRTVLF